MNGKVKKEGKKKKTERKRNKGKEGRKVRSEKSANVGNKRMKEERMGK